MVVLKLLGIGVVGKPAAHHIIAKLNRPFITSE